MRDQARRLARHPAVFDWLYGSDNPPPPKIEKMYLQVLQECNWPNPHQSSATARATEVTGPSGVKMLGHTITLRRLIGTSTARTAVRMASILRLGRAIATTDRDFAAHASGRAPLASDTWWNITPAAVRSTI